MTVTDHSFAAKIAWTGNRGDGTRTYRGYDRTWNIATDGHVPIACSNDPRLGGDPTRPNPEDLLLSALSACHMLWFLHLASQAGIVVTSYVDEPLGIGESLPNGAGRFVRAILSPAIGVLPGADLARANELHHEVERYCFIARSLNFPVTVEASYSFTDAS
jgi:organic hydroperoxide reductase OsmC/OhrA